MIRRVKARAYANIALIKYWGKYSVAGNIPATPSISLALESLATETEIVRTDSNIDEILINDAPAEADSYRRISSYLDLWRDKGIIWGRFSITSKNNFPTASGLASSASGFAALAKALSGFAERKLSLRELSILARLGSGSAARSIPGGLAVMPKSKNPSARLLYGPKEINFAMVIVITERDNRKIPSTEGMLHSSKTSPYYRLWLKQALVDYKAMLTALRKTDFPKIGEIAEWNALAMHSCMIASRSPLIYWNPTTLEIITAVRKWREGGIKVYFTIDAGPNVALICRRDEIDRITEMAEGIDGVIDVIPSEPGAAAEIIEIE